MPPGAKLPFVLAFSGGKDSHLALYHLVQAGYEPVALLTMFREEMGRSWIHGLDKPLLRAISQALNIPLLICHAGGKSYAGDMERCLVQAKNLGAKACAFGDIDIQEHRLWNEARCQKAGLEALLPLWGRNREENTKEALRLGYRCLIKCLAHDLPEAFLGQPLSWGLLEEMQKLGIDICGENGEYHTLVVDGPLFRHEVKVENRGLVRLGQITAANLVLQED